jgi:hypothetical protein
VVDWWQQHFEVSSGRATKVRRRIWILRRYKQCLYANTIYQVGRLQGEHPNRTVDQLNQQAKAIFASWKTLPARHIVHIVDDLGNF